MKVVIIDDDKSSGKALADLLETKYDMEVLGCALCGLDGLAMVNRYQPDVLFLDVQLPDVNGLDFLDKLSGFVHRRCQVVMYTAYDEYILTAFRKQAFDVLLKPINPQELDTIVSRLTIERTRETAWPVAYDHRHIITSHLSSYGEEATGEEGAVLCQLLHIR